MANGLLDKVIAAKVTPRDWQRLDDLARREDRTRSNVLRGIIREYFEQ